MNESQVIVVSDGHKSLADVARHLQLMGMNVSKVVVGWNGFCIEPQRGSSFSTYREYLVSEMGMPARRFKEPNTPQFNGLKRQYNIAVARKDKKEQSRLLKQMESLY